MRTDPRLGMVVSLALVAAAAVWLALAWLAGDSLHAALGDLSHAITLLAILVFLAGIGVALLFRRYAAVRADLLAGRNVIAQWHVDAEAFRAFAGIADARDRSEKRGALLLMLGFLALAFGGMALFDPEVAVPMLSVGALVALLLTGAYLMSNRIRRSHLEPASGEVIVGTEGLLVNGVLHVWIAFLSWLVDAELEAGKQPVLVITYAILVRYGPQFVTVPLPVPARALAQAEEVVRRLGERLGRPPSRRARKARPDLPQIKRRRPDPS